MGDGDDTDTPASINVSAISQPSASAYLVIAAIWSGIDKSRSACLCVETRAYRYEAELTYLMVLWFSSSGPMDIVSRSDCLGKGKTRGLGALVRF
jgi:hypothetical protein